MWAGFAFLKDFSQSSNVPVNEPEQVERDTTSQMKEAGKLKFQVWPDFKYFRIWQINFTSEGESLGRDGNDGSCGGS